MIVDELGGEVDVDAVKAIVLEVDLQMPLHNLPRMIGQYGMRDRVILTVEPCRFLGHLHLRH